MMSYKKLSLIAAIRFILVFTALISSKHFEKLWFHFRVFRCLYILKMSHIVTRRLSVKRKYSPDASDQTRISEAQLSKVIEGFILC